VELGAESSDDEKVNYGEGEEEVEGDANAQDNIEVGEMQEVINTKGAETSKVQPSNPYDFY